MASESRMTQLLTYFKALADKNRLKILGILALESQSVEQLAALLHLRPSTISHHLAKLAAADLVSARAEGYYSVYQLETGALEKMARQISKETFSGLTAMVDLEAYDRQVVANFSAPDGSLKTIPSQLTKRKIVLRYLVGAFQHGRSYPESEVNGILARYHPDTATLRRELVAEKLLARESGVYWRTISAGKTER
jgi:predicted transcriptional regulator